MSNKQTEYSTQQLDNLGADVSVSPPIVRRGILGIDANGDYRTFSVGTDGSLIATSAMVPKQYDYVSLTEASLTDTYTFKTGGSGGTTVATITITYTDTGKGTLSSVART